MSETAEHLAGMLATLRALPEAVDDRDRIDRIRALEDLRGAVAAAQARETAAFAASRRAEHAAMRTRAEFVERDIAGQVGLARRVSPFAARRYVGFAAILTRELPETREVLAPGATSEWRAMLVARNTVFLSRDQRGQVDAAIARELPGLGDKRIDAVTRDHAYRLDAAGAVARIGAAEKDRRVTVRPAPDVMARLSALLPVAQAVAIYAALSREADRLRAEGDPRSRGQLMADVCTERLLGRSGGELPVELELVMTDQTLLGDPRSSEAAAPAWLVGYGPVPARYARRLVLDSPDSAPRWLRRLFRHPPCRPRQVSRRRRRTAIGNGQGTCAACNQTKQAPGWHGRTGPDGGIEITVPTGHRYLSPLPRPPSTPVERCAWQRIERALRAA